MNQYEANQLRTVMTYAADLELEVDRLRRREQFLNHEVQRFSKEVYELSDDQQAEVERGVALQKIKATTREFRSLLADIDEPPGYHPAFDQVIAVAVRPLAESVFRWHQRITAASNAELRLELDREYIEWFPARLRHIFDNLFSNALRSRDPHKGEMRVGLQLQTRHNGYEFRFTDNGLGIPVDQTSGMLEIFHRAAPTRSAGLGVGLAVVKFLVEQCCGTISVQSDQGQGSDVTVWLPRYDMHDHIESELPTN